jgi:hypothetical protein
MGSLAAGRAVSAALDPVLTAAGFAGGQYGEGGGDQPGPWQIIFCAGHDDLSDRHPWMPQANAQRHAEGACIDLVVHTTLDDRFDWADLEGLTLDETLRRVGNDDDANAVRAVHLTRLDTALPVLAAALARLFGEAR